jgi:hypothetical protein
MDAARRGEGTKIIDSLSDPAFKGMEKWEYKLKSTEGRDSVVHDNRDPATGELTDFKFKRRSTDTGGRYESVLEAGKR